MTKNKEIFTTFYTSHTVCENVPLPIDNVLHAYCIASKNIYNSTLFLIRHIFSAYSYNNSINQDTNIYSLKNKLHQNEQEVITLFNEVINTLNVEHYNKNIKKQSSNKNSNSINDNNTNNISNKDLNKPNIKPKYQLFTDEINKTTYYQCINPTLLINVLKLKEFKNPIYKDYTEINSHVAVVAVNKAIQDIENYLSSLKSFYNTQSNTNNNLNNNNTVSNIKTQSNTKFLGKPQMPRYKSKQSRIGFKLGKDKITSSGHLARVITCDNINLFSSIKDKTNINKLYLDNNKTQLVNQKDINDYNNFNFNELVNRIFKYYKLNQSTNIYSTLVEIKFIPINDNYTITSTINKQENINNVNYNLDNDNSDKTKEVINSNINLKNKKLDSSNSLSKLKPKIKIEIVVENTVKLAQNSMLEKVIAYQPEFLTLEHEKQIQIVQELFNTTRKIDKLKIANADLGVKNSATITFNTNHKAIVLSNDLYYKQINKVDEKIDKLKSSLVPSQIKQIQQEHNKEKQQYLEKTKQLFMDIVNSKEYKQLQHKVSSSGNNSLEKTNKQKIKNNTNFNNNNANIEQQILNSLFNEKVKALTKPKLNQQQLSLLKLHYETIYSNNELIQLQSYKENFKKDYLHKLSKFILDDQ